MNPRTNSHNPVNRRKGFPSLFYTFGQLLTLLNERTYGKYFSGCTETILATIRIDKVDAVSLRMEANVDRGHTFLTTVYLHRITERIVLYH